MTKRTCRTSRQELPSFGPLEEGGFCIHPSLKTVIDWYFGKAFGLGLLQGKEGVPFYCDPARVGGFAVDPKGLAAGDDKALFRLFIQLSMFQALRDEVIIRQQRTFTAARVAVLADAGFLEAAIVSHQCPALRAGVAFEETCDVAKSQGVVDCGICPGGSCHVKGATLAFNRMGDMGKLPTSAWLRLWQQGGLSAVLAEVVQLDPSPAIRAHLLVDRLGQVHRVGRKLATLIVSALSTPALAPGLTPWFPEVDGHDLVVVDTNVARAVDILRGPGAARTYQAREAWVRGQAALIDLREYRADLPKYSPRLVQQGLYAFCSRSNRIAQEDVCMGRSAPCLHCAPTLCPFAGGDSKLFPKNLGKRSLLTGSVQPEPTSIQGQTGIPL